MRKFKNLCNSFSPALVAVSLVMLNSQTVYGDDWSGDKPGVCGGEISEKCGTTCELTAGSIVAKIEGCSCGTEEFDDIKDNECLFCNTINTSSNKGKKGKCNKNACNLGCIKVGDCQGGDKECSFCVPPASADPKTFNVSAEGTCKKSSCGAVCEKDSDCEGGSGSQICKRCVKQGNQYGKCVGTVTQLTAVRNARVTTTVSSSESITQAKLGMEGNSKCFSAINLPTTLFTETQGYWSGSNGAGTLNPNQKSSNDYNQKYAAYMGVCAGGYNNGNCTTTCDVAKVTSGLTEGEKETLCEVMKGLNEDGSDYTTAVNSKSSYFLDENCNIITLSAEDLKYLDIDIATMYTLSPISLVWDNEKISAAIVQFQLGLTDSKKYIIWQGSKSTPLLVFDPEKKGSITNGKQLFGDVAFGKKWKNGFEALASLDKNSDKKVSGAELKPLSLWFDKNQNGISEKGEVIDLQEAGVTELYYEISGDNAITGSIIANNGYLRVDKNKKQITGKLVDWYSAEFDSKAEAKKVLDKQNKDLDKLSNGKANPFTGVWAWSDKNNLTSEPNGILIISNDNGKIRGFSIAEVKFGKNPKGVKSAVIRTPLKNIVYSENGSKKEIKFTLDLDGVKTNSTVELSSNGNALYGVSRSERLDENGEKEFVNYSWNAKQLYE
ncbi:MAG: hypothetical protein LBE20_03955 [Deltaproteobacteria bacterium]|jgi:hypothetical protein|nr:hypothetical protein [Deltaproteobacteria bacterium]